MKLIIDISEDTYTECQGNVYFPDTGAELFDAVKNGTPLDDIKAEIKEKISHYDHFQGSNTANGLNIALEIIDKNMRGEKG